jgi:hypothetical protein
LLIILYPIIMDKTTTITTTILIFLLSMILMQLTANIVLGNDRNVLVEYIYSLTFEAQSILSILAILRFFVSIHHRMRFVPYDFCSS